MFAVIISVVHIVGNAQNITRFEAQLFHVLSPMTDQCFLAVEYLLISNSFVKYLSEMSSYVTIAYLSTKIVYVVE